MRVLSCRLPNGLSIVCNGSACRRWGTGPLQVVVCCCPLLSKVRYVYVFNLLGVVYKTMIVLSVFVFYMVSMRCGCLEAEAIAGMK